MIIKSQYNKGTALLVTILLAGAVGTIAFGLFKITNSELFIGIREEEGIEALYAAQAGVEDALMRFKFKQGNNLEIPEGAREDTQSVVRVDVNSGLIGRINNYLTNNPNPKEDQYIYDLKVWSKTDRYQVTLEKDQSVILDVSEPANNGEQLIVRWEPEGRNRANTRLWYRLMDPISTSTDPRGLDRKFFTYLAYPQDNTGNPARSRPDFVNVSPLPAGINNNNFSLYGFGTLKFKAFGDSGSRINLTVRKRGNSAGYIGGPDIFIESTGYYGGTARKIKVKVDRESKSILDIFDYVIYSGRKDLP